MGCHLVFLIHFLYLLTSEGQDEYENDGFIVDDIEDEEEQDEEERADSDDERQKKKKRKKKSVFRPNIFFNLCLWSKKCICVFVSLEKQQNV